MRSMPSKSKLNGDVVNLTACVVLASQRRPADARGFGAAREPHTTIAYAMYPDHTHTGGGGVSRAASPSEAAHREGGARGTAILRPSTCLRERARTVASINGPSESPRRGV
jgi:hypothetical protein